jgi:hypothetical protein
MVDSLAISGFDGDFYNDIDINQTELSNSYDCEITNYCTARC